MTDLAPLNPVAIERLVGAWERRHWIILAAAAGTASTSAEVARRIQAGQGRPYPTTQVGTVLARHAARSLVERVDAGGNAPARWSLTPRGVQVLTWGRAAGRLP